jgi:hypothetical protein
MNIVAFGIAILGLAGMVGALRLGHLAKKTGGIILVVVVMVVVVSPDAETAEKTGEYFGYLVIPALILGMVFQKSKAGKARGVAAGNGRIVSRCVVVGLALMGIFVAVGLRPGGLPAQGTAGTLGQRLLAHSRDRDDYRLFVGVPPANPKAWAEVVQIDDSSVTLHDSQVLGLAAVTAYLVAYPSGALVNYRCPNELPVPAWVRFPEDSGPPDRDLLSADDLKEGQSLVRVEFGKSTSEPGSGHHYSTTLTNVSGKRVQVLRFGGYPKGGET